MLFNFITIFQGKGRLMKIGKFTNSLILCSSLLGLAFCPNVFALEGTDFENDFLIWNDDDSYTSSHTHNEGDGYYDGSKELNFDEPDVIDVEKYNFINGYSSTDGSSASTQRNTVYTKPPLSSSTRVNTTSKPKPRVISKNDGTTTGGIQISSDDTVNKVTTTTTTTTEMTSADQDIVRGPVDNSNISKSINNTLDSAAIDESFAAIDMPGNTSDHFHSDVRTYSHPHTHDTNCGHYQPKDMNDNKQEIVIAGKDINQALNSLEKMERYRKKRIIKVKDENMRKYGLGARVAVDWSGPIEPLMREIAAFSGYNFKVLGLEPAIPVIASVSHEDVELGDIARDVHLQSKDRADIVIYPNSRTIELRYIELG